MDYRRFDGKIVARIDKGEEILEKISEIVHKEKIHTASISGLGATDDFSVGVYDVEKKVFHANRFRGSFEIVSLCGTVSTMNGSSYLHLHMSAANEKGEVFGGHLKSAAVSATCEIVLDIINGIAERQYDEETGLNLFRFV